MGKKSVSFHCGRGGERGTLLSPLLTLEGFSSVQVVIGWQEKVQANFSVDLTKNAFSSDELIDDEATAWVSTACKMTLAWEQKNNQPFLGSQ